MSELYHHGVKGQKWGVRRFQNKDGSLTKAGKAHVHGKSFGDRLHEANLNRKAKKLADQKEVEKRAAKLAKEKKKESATDHEDEKSLEERTRDLRKKNDYLRALNDNIQLEKSYKEAGKSAVRKTLEKSALDAVSKVATKQLTRLGNHAVDKLVDMHKQSKASNSESSAASSVAEKVKSTVSKHVAERKAIDPSVSSAAMKKYREGWNAAKKVLHSDDTDFIAHVDSGLEFVFGVKL